MSRVFIVEDSPMLRTRLERLVGSLPGAELVGLATSAREAIDGILQARPDVVLLDLSLERSSGFDVLREVAGRAPATAFYVLSNFASEPYRRHAERLGAKGFFDKSTEIERVGEAIAAARH